MLFRLSCWTFSVCYFSFHVYIRRPSDVKENHSHFFLQKLLGYFLWFCSSFVSLLWGILFIYCFISILGFLCAIFKQFLSSSSVVFCLFVVIYFSFLSYMLIIYVCMCTHTYTNVYLFNKKWKALLILKKKIWKEKSQYISLWSDLQTKILTSDMKLNKTRVEKICNQIHVSDFICRFY